MVNPMTFKFHHAGHPPSHHCFNHQPTHKPTQPNPPPPSPYHNIQLHYTWAYIIKYINKCVMCSDTHLSVEHLLHGKPKGVIADHKNSRETFNDSYPIREHVTSSERPPLASPHVKASLRTFLLTWTSLFFFFFFFFVCLFLYILFTVPYRLAFGWALVFTLHVDLFSLARIWGSFQGKGRLFPACIIQHHNVYWS